MSFLEEKSIERMQVLAKVADIRNERLVGVRTPEDELIDLGKGVES